MGNHTDVHYLRKSPSVMVCVPRMWLGVLGRHSGLGAGNEVKKIPLASCEHLPLCVGVWWG